MYTIKDIYHLTRPCVHLVTVPSKVIDAVYSLKQHRRRLLDPYLLLCERNWVHLDFLLEKRVSEFKLFPNELKCKILKLLHITSSCIWVCVRDFALAGEKLCGLLILFLCINRYVGVRRVFEIRFKFLSMKVTWAFHCLFKIFRQCFLFISCNLMKWHLGKFS